MNSILSKFLPTRLIFAAMFFVALATQSWSQVKVLVYRGYFGYEHSALITATTAIQKSLPTLLGTTPAFTVDTVIAAAGLTATKLAGYQVLVLNNNTGLGGLNTAQRSAVLNFGNTKGIVAIHSTADFKGGETWDSIVRYIGGSLDGHTAAMGTLNIEPGTENHPLNAGLGNAYSMNDEWYGYASNPRNIPGTKVLWTIDEKTAGNFSAGGQMGADHPIAWYKELPGGGRMFYTSQGHRDSIIEKNVHARRLLYNAILWAGKSSASRISTGPVTHSVQGFGFATERGSLNLSFSEDGEHSFTVSTIKGRRVDQRQGKGVKSYSITNLIPGTIYVVSGRSKTSGPFSKMVVIP